MSRECGAQLCNVPEYFEQAVRAPRKMSPHGLKSVRQCESWTGSSSRSNTREDSNAPVGHYRCLQISRTAAGERKSDSHTHTVNSTVAQIPSGTKPRFKQQQEQNRSPLLDITADLRETASTLMVCETVRAHGSTQDCGWHRRSCHEHER